MRLWREQRERVEELGSSLRTEQEVLGRFEARQPRIRENQRIEQEKRATSNQFFKSLKEHTKDHKTPRTNYYKAEHEMGKTREGKPWEPKTKPPKPDKPTQADRERTRRYHKWLDNQEGSAIPP